MQRITALWNRGWIGKAVISLVGLLVVCCVIGILVPRSQQQPPAASAPATSAPAVQQAQQPQAAVSATEAQAPTAAPKPTEPPKPTDAPAPTNTPEPTAPPTAPPTPTAAPEPVVLKGHGKVVTDAFTPPALVNRVTFEHTGQRNFIVQSYTKDGKQDYLVNKIGPYRGQRPLFGDQEVYFEINADGDWTVTIEPIGQNDAFSAGIDGEGDVVSDVFMPASEGAVPYTFSHDGKRNFIVQLHCAGGDGYVANEIGATQGQVVVRMKEGPCLWEVQADGKWSVKPK
jgi:hypothetical protein